MTGVLVVLAVSGVVLLMYGSFMVGAGISYRRGLRESDDPPSAIRSRKRPRRFLIVRDEDVSGVSGTGVVCEGIQFSTKHAAIHWASSQYPWTTPVPEGVDAILEVHGHGGKTRLVWIDDA